MWKLLVARREKGLLLEDFDPVVVENQRRLGRDVDDYFSMVVAHQNTTYEAKILGIHIETRRRLLVTLDGEEVEFVEANPFVRNIWVGENVRLYSPDQAVVYEYALRWDTVGGQTPEMVVYANNGYFYPATRNDSIVNVETDWEIEAFRGPPIPDFNIDPKPR